MDKSTLALTFFMLGVVYAAMILTITSRWPQDIRNQLCAEANWQLPSCKDYLEKGIKELKGEK